MALLPAYAVDGGRVPAAMARRAVFASSAGADGVNGPDDLKVTALPTPGLAVQISRGSALCPMLAAGQNQFESYVIAQDTSSNIAVPGTPSTRGRTEYIIARVTDWHFTGDAAPADPLNAIYWEFARVASITGITVPHVVLARISIPASTSAITNAMIRDMRKVANPRKERHLFVHRVNAVDTDALTQSVTSTWPNVFENTVRIPAWATHAQMIGTFAQVYFPSGDFEGVIFASLGNAGPFTQDVRIEAPPTTSRQTMIAAGVVEIPHAMRGTDTVMKLRGRRIAGGTASAPVLRSGSAVTLDVEFEERAN